MTIDIFCHVIDYFGDVAVSYRLAKALKRLDSHLHIRFFCSHPQLIDALYPNHSHDDIPLFSYHQAGHLPHNVDVAIEAFACTLPANYQKPTLIINLEYLTAETWIESYHKQESIGMNPNGKKFFFFPSFSAVGSLTHGEFLTHISHHNPSSAKQYLSQILHLPPTFIHRPWLLVYLYEIDEATIKELAKHFAIIVIGDQHHYDHSWIITRRCEQAIFDKLIITSDHSLIRGEDSLSRAVLAGKPFLWQAYKQEDNYHLVKVEALSYQLATLIDNADTLLSWQALQQDINNSGNFDVQQFINLPTTAFEKIAQVMRHLPSLEVNLYHFMEEYLSI